jgi:hypothetical protein
MLEDLSTLPTGQNQGLKTVTDHGVETPTLPCAKLSRESAVYSSSAAADTYMPLDTYLRTRILHLRVKGFNGGELDRPDRVPHVGGSGIDRIPMKEPFRPSGQRIISRL